MNGTDYTSIIDALSATEGVFTTAQAARLGVPRNVLAKACDAGKLTRVAHGAYRSAASPSSPFDTAAAAWKLTDADKMSHERMQASNWDGITVAGATAASLQGLGDFYLSPFRLLAPRRINTRSEDVRFGIRQVDREDVSFEFGMPVTRPERTLVDLVLDHEDPSLIHDAYQDAVGRGIDSEHLQALATRLCTSKRNATIAKIVFEKDGGQ